MHLLLTVPTYREGNKNFKSNIFISVQFYKALYNNGNNLTVNSTENITLSVLQLKCFLKLSFAQMCHTVSFSKHLYFQHRFFFTLHVSRYY